MTIIVGTKKYTNITLADGVASFALWELDKFIGYQALPVEQLDEIIS